MKRTAAALVVLSVVAWTSAVNGEDSSRQKFLDFFSAIVGDWQIPESRGGSLDYHLALSKSKACFIAETADATHIHGWNPEQKCVSVVSFFANGNQAVADLHFVDDKTIAGDVTTRRADGTKREFQLTWRVVSSDRMECNVGDRTMDVLRSK